MFLPLVRGQGYAGLIQNVKMSMMTHRRQVKHMMIARIKKICLSLSHFMVKTSQEYALIQTV
jgi:hypothetical protein